MKGFTNNLIGTLTEKVKKLPFLDIYVEFTAVSLISSAAGRKDVHLLHVGQFHRGVLFCGDHRGFKNPLGHVGVSKVGQGHDWFLAG